MAVLDDKRLMAFFPPEVMETQQNSLQCDPLPPPGTLYDPQFFLDAGIDVNAPQYHTRHSQDRQLGELVPDPILLGQLEGFFNRHPGLMAQFPGGLVQFLQVVGGMDEGELVQMMEMQAEGGNMPGAMPDVVDTVEPLYENEAETEEPEIVHNGEDDAAQQPTVEALPVRLIRGLLNRFWGSTGTDNDGRDDPDNNPVD